MGEKGAAFVKGGCGCIMAFLAIGVFFVLIGGSMHIDLGGALMLFVIGGIMGLIVLAIYNHGARSGQRNAQSQQSQSGRHSSPDFSYLDDDRTDRFENPW